MASQGLPDKVWRLKIAARLVRLGGPARGQVGTGVACGSCWLFGPDIDQQRPWYRAGRWRGDRHGCAFEFLIWPRSYSATGRRTGAATARKRERWWA